VLSVVIAAMGVVLWWMPDQARWLAPVIAVCGFACTLILNVFRPPIPSVGRKEPAQIDELSAQRRRELVRGTSLYLRELKYRYSIRLDSAPTSDQKCFTAEVNTVKLGFVPVVIIDNTNDRQGYGYVAFVHDGKRWRGPGLPCPAGQVEAVRHAARCVSPLASDEETKF
jgi:hypothetical protein